MKSLKDYIIDKHTTASVSNVDIDMDLYLGIMIKLYNDIVNGSGVYKTAYTPKQLEFTFDFGRQSGKSSAATLLTRHILDNTDSYVIYIGANMNINRIYERSLLSFGSYAPIKDYSILTPITINREKYISYLPRNKNIIVIWDDTLITRTKSDNKQNILDFYNSLDRLVGSKKIIHFKLGEN